MVNIMKKNRKEEEKWINHYSSKQKILLVGEGDFSFAVCLATAFGDATNIIATSLDSKDKVEGRYGKGKNNLEMLKNKGCVVLHQVDALTMSTHVKLCSLKFDRIVFNFPHAYLLLREHNPIQIQLHQELVEGFLKSAKKLLAKNGEVHITHKTAHPFNRWNIEELASKARLSKIDEVEFYSWDYPGYINKKGEAHGTKCDHSFPIGACSTFMFSN